MQVIERDGKPFKLIADEGMKLSKNRQIFVNKVFLSTNDNINNWEEVGYDVWGCFIDEIPTNKAEKLECDIKSLLEKQLELSEILLDTDFRLMCLEMGITP